MNNRQKNKLIKYALIAFVIYLVWRKMSAGYGYQYTNSSGKTITFSTPEQKSDYIKGEREKKRLDAGNARTEGTKDGKVVMTGRIRR